VRAEDRKPQTPTLSQSGLVTNRHSVSATAGLSKPAASKASKPHERKKNIEQAVAAAPPRIALLLFCVAQCCKPQEPCTSGTLRIARFLAPCKRMMWSNESATGCLRRNVFTCSGRSLTRWVFLVRQTVDFQCYCDVASLGLEVRKSLVRANVRICDMPDRYGSVGVLRALQIVISMISANRMPLT